MSQRRNLAVVAIAFVVACAQGRPGPPRNLPPPMQSTTLNPGDVFVVMVVGEKDLPQEFRVQPDGTIDYPYVNRVHVAGMEPQEIAALLKTRLREAKILSDPQVTLVVKQYSSKQINVIGQVTKPGPVIWREGMKLVESISAAGGFTPIADSNHVILVRKSGDKTVTAVVSVDAITDGQQPDIPLQTGDTIKVDQRVF